MENMLVRFVHRKGKSVGVVIAKYFPEINRVVVTGSLCRSKKDRFTKEDAMALAEERAKVTAFEDRPCPLAHSLKKDVEYMVERARRYFKGKPVTEPVIKAAIKPPPGLAMLRDMLKKFNISEGEIRA